MLLPRKWLALCGLATQCEMNVKLCCTCWSAKSACAATFSKWPYTAPPYEAVLVASFTACVCVCAAQFQVSGGGGSGVVALPEVSRLGFKVAASYLSSKARRRSNRTAHPCEQQHASPISRHIRAMTKSASLHHSLFLALFMPGAKLPLPSRSYILLPTCLHLAGLCPRQL